MLKITIPAPCYEDWEAMTPNHQGRHCTACAKTVVDFTAMTDEEVKYFLLHQQEKTLCGRFKNEQLQRITIALPANIFQIHLPLWKQFLTACLLAFSSMLFSCNAVIDKSKGTTYHTLEYNMQDAIPAPNRGEFSGMVGMFPINDTMPYLSNPPKICSITQGFTVLSESFMQGDYIVETAVPEQPILEEPLCPVLLIDSAKENKIIPTSPDSTQTKNPPKADSANCNNMKYY
jgi:hypothetical protein